ncbi:MAG: lipopolysaccharide biosynthesis protein [Candidatus Krumholzibacteriia bacterium]
MIASGLLARAWPMADFLLFASLRRYLATLHCVVTAELRYGIVKYSFDRESAARRRVLWNAVYLTATLFLLVAGATQLAARWIYPYLGPALADGRGPLLLVSLWLLGQAWFHVGQAYLRSTGQIHAANALCFLAGTVVILLLAVAALVTRAVSVPLFFGLTGLVTAAIFLAFAFAQRRSASPVPDPGLCARMAGYSSSRFLDSLLRQFAYTLPVMVASALGQLTLAGQIAVMVSAVRSFDGLFQPLIVLVFADSLGARSPDSARRTLQATWDVSLALTLPVLVAVGLLSRPLLSLWLGSRYADLAPAFAALCTTLLPTVTIVLVRGYLDSLSRFSPFVVLNAVSVAMLGAGTVMLHAHARLTPLNMAVLISLVNWGQLVVVYRMLRKAYGLRLFDGNVIRRAVARARGRSSGKDGRPCA